MYWIQEPMRRIKPHESSGICHEMFLVITPIFKSTQNLKTPPLCESITWLVLNAVCLKLTNQLRLVKIERELCLGMLMELVILSLFINMLSTHQADCFQVMEEKHHTISFMVVHSFMMQLLVLSGLRIKSLFVI